MAGQKESPSIAQGRQVGAQGDQAARVGVLFVATRVVAVRGAPAVRFAVVIARTVVVMFASVLAPHPPQCAAVNLEAFGEERGGGGEGFATLPKIIFSPRGCLRDVAGLTSPLVATKGSSPPRSQ